jgi:hypothetical protein
MPIAIVRSLSLPNLKIYTTISLLLVSGCVYYSFNVVKDPNWKLQNNTTIHLHQHASPQSILSKSSNDAVSTVAEHLISSLTKASSSSESDTDEVKEQVVELEKPVIDNLPVMNLTFNETRTFTTHLRDTFSFMSQEPICIWVSFRKSLL